MRSALLVTFVAIFTGCSPPEGAPPCGVGTCPQPTDGAASDVAASLDVATDIAADVAADAAMDVAADAAMDVAADAAMDVAADVAADFAVDVAADVGVDVTHDAAEARPDDVPSSTGTCGVECRAAYFPLIDGLRWEYRVTNGTRSGCGASMTASMAAVAGSEGVFRRQYSCGPYPITDFRQQDTTIYNFDGVSTWYRFMALPPSEGARWAAGGLSGASFQWSAVGTVAVPAGTFTDCWRKSQIGYRNSEVYCRGVGMVSASWHEWDFDYDLELTGRNF